MGDEHRQLALFRARLEMICETIARLRARMGGHTLPFAGAGRSGPDKAADGTAGKPEGDR
jgi:hypothetical protein